MHVQVTDSVSLQTIAAVIVATLVMNVSSIFVMAQIKHHLMYVQDMENVSLQTIAAVTVATLVMNVS
jgi:hypothetical protein